MTIEVEIKFRVPDAARRALRAALGPGAQPPRAMTLAARYFDTPDRRLARAGLAWRLRREGRRWVQTLKAGGDGALQRFEHEVDVSQPLPDARLHADSEPGQRLLRLLADAQAAGQPLTERYRVEVRRTLRLLRPRGAQVELAFDEGWIVAGERRLRVCELEFECRAGSSVAMLALAERWRARVGLWLDVSTKAERGDRLAEGEALPPPRRAGLPRYAAPATARQAFVATVDECLDQVARNALGLCDGDAAQRAEHVHQLRVGIRRLRSALRCFRGWVEAPPQGAVAGLRQLFDQLGRTRDDDVLHGPVAAAMAAAGAPAWAPPAAAARGDAVALLRGDAAQRVLLDWLRWRTDLASRPAPPAAADAQPLARRARRRLQRWQRRLQADVRDVDRLDETGLHELRKRVKRQRYALEFFAPLLKRRDLARTLDALAPLQERLGELNDLHVARERLRALAPREPSAWFALGWLSARIDCARAAVGPALQRLARCEVPRLSGRVQLGA